MIKVKKIVFFVTGLDSGGLENYLLRFLDFKASSFSEIVVFCKGGKGGLLESQFREIPNVSIKIQKISYFNPIDYFKLLIYLKKNNFDTVCDFTGNFAGIILKIAKMASIDKRVVFYRGSTDRFQSNLIKKKYNNWVKNLVYKNASAILSNSRAALDFFFPYIWQTDIRFKIIHNGIDASQFEVGNRNLRDEFGIPEKAFVIGHTGRFNVAKNHNVIMAVSKILTKKYDDIYIILCGNGVLDNLKNIVSNYDKIKLFENRTDIPVFLNTMDAYFFPSITEGQPNALIEAMLSGLPFVASNIDPISETVGPYSENLLEPNDVEGFISSLELLYQSRSGRNYIQKSDMAEKFDYQLRFNEFYNILI